MKSGIHPDYKPAKVVCACGNVIETRSVRGDFHIEICSQCHPFFTGKQKILDTAGRIEKFRTRYAAQSTAPAPKKPEPKKPSLAKAEQAKENRAAKRARTGKTKAGKAETPPGEAKVE